MPGLWTLSSIASGIERKYKLRNPKPSHFKIKQHTGLGYRIIGAKDERWYVHNKNIPSLIDGPYSTKDEAYYAVQLIIRILKIQNPKLRAEDRARLQNELTADALSGALGPRIQSLVRAQSYLDQAHRSSLEETSGLEQDTNKKCPFCAEMIKAAAIVCRYCGRDLPS